MKIVNRRAVSLIEFAILLVIIMLAYSVLQYYIERGFFGLWKKPGEVFGFGRQYDTQKTIDCQYDDQLNLWYDRTCFETLRDQECVVGDTACEEGIINNLYTPGEGCAGSACNAMNTNPPPNG